MKYHFTNWIWGTIILIVSHFSANAMLADSLKIGFEKDTIKVLEGNKSEVIGIILSNGLIPQDSTIEITWSIIDTDATKNKDFEILGDNKFIFSRTEAKTQKRYFEIKAFKDQPIENETILIELKVTKGNGIPTILLKKECRIIIQDVKSEVEQLREEFQLKNEEIINRIKTIIDKDKDTTEVIGTISLKSAKVNVYTWGDTSKSRCFLNKFKKNSTFKGYSNDSTYKKRAKPIELIEIEKADIQFKYGIATEIRVFSKNFEEIFSNHWFHGINKRPRFGVSFRHSTFNNLVNYYRLVNENDPNRFIYLSDVIKYSSRTGLNFAPSDAIVTLENKTDKNKADISVKTSLNSYANLNIYTDMLGLLKIDQGNGIVQSDASAKIYLSTLPAKNRLRFKFNYLMPYARYARFENGFQNIPNSQNKSFGLGKNDTINRMLLNQRKFFDFGLKLNLYNRIGKFDNTFEFNILAGFGWFNRQGPIDSVLTKKTGSLQYQGLLSNTFDLGAETRVAIVQYRNFGMNLGIMANLQKIINAQENNIKDGGFKPVYRTEAEIYYYPIQNSRDKIFLRTYYTFNNNTKEENFLRVQIGYKALFNFPNKK